MSRASALAMPPTTADGSTVSDSTSRLPSLSLLPLVPSTLPVSTKVPGGILKVAADPELAHSRYRPLQLFKTNPRLRWSDVASHGQQPLSRVSVFVTEEVMDDDAALVLFLLSGVCEWRNVWSIFFEVWSAFFFAENVVCVDCPIVSGDWRRGCCAGPRGAVC